MVTTIIKPTHFCNLKCDYCYIEQEAESGRMNDSLLEKMLLQVGSVNKQRISEIIWHGGEPLLMGIDFYEQVRYIQYWVEKETGTKFRNNIQSNGSLLDKTWAKYLRDNDFTVGFSLDGPEEINDKTRKKKNGQGAFSHIIKGINLAKEYGIGNGFIVVLNKNNIDHVKEIYQFVKENKYGVKFNPLIHSGNACKNMDSLGITPNEYATAMNTLFDLYFRDEEFKNGMEPFDSIIANIVFNKPNGTCTYSKNCQEGFVSIGPKGDVYPCGRFDGIDEFHMGNIQTDELEDILEGDVRKYLLSRKLESLQQCSPCSFKEICNGGCMSNGYMREGNIMDKDYYCKSYQQIFAHMKKEIKKELKNAEVN